MLRFRSRHLSAAVVTVVLASGHAFAQAPAARTRGPAAGSAARADAATRAADAGPSAAEQQRRAQVVARVGETSITVGEFEDMLNEAPAPVRQSYQEPGRRREFLENIIHTLLLADE